MAVYFIGVDMGTASVRAAIVSETGNVLVSHSAPIAIHRPPSTEMYEQSSRDIWSQCCLVIRECLKSCSGSVDPKCIRAIGFDATCSLVVLDRRGQPLPVSRSSSFDIIMWMDHRAHAETELINATDDPVLDNVGGRISVEMQMPKLMWLKANMTSTWSAIGYVFDLPDFLTAMACHDKLSYDDDDDDQGNKTDLSIRRSLCSAVCKWTYGPDSGWSHSFLSSVGLDDLLSKNEGRALGNMFSAPGQPIGTVCKRFAEETGLSPDTLVAASLIDAYSGALGTLGVASDIEHAMALISGTSSCHICLTADAVLVDGVWGPFQHVLLPKVYCLEAGQSAAGKLIDHVVQSHPAYQEVKNAADGRHINVYAYLNEQVKLLAEKQTEDPAMIASLYHMTPDFHGNRSPLALADIRGCIIGESLDNSAAQLIVKYCATLLSIAYGTLQILQHLKRNGVEINELVISGGLCMNELFIKFHADVCQLPVVVPAENQHSVLLGSAILAASAFDIKENNFSDADLSSILKKSMKRMTAAKFTVQPSADPKLIKYHARKFDIYTKLQALARE